MNSELQCCAIRYHESIQLLNFYVRSCLLTNYSTCFLAPLYDMVLWIFVQQSDSKVRISQSCVNPIQTDKSAKGCFFRSTERFR